MRLPVALSFSLFLFLVFCFFHLLIWETSIGYYDCGWQYCIARLF